MYGWLYICHIIFVVGVGSFMSFCCDMSWCVRYECFVCMLDMLSCERRFVWCIL